MALPPYILRGGRVLRNGAGRPDRADILVGGDGRIAAIGPGLAGDGAAEVDLAGRLVTPGLVDAHQHLDKALTRRAVANPDGTLDGAIVAFRNYAGTITGPELRRRAEQAIERCLAHGTVAIRTHANVDPELTWKSVAALAELRDDLRERLTLQVVAFVTSGATRAGAPAEQWLEAAVEAGADVIGGTPAIADDPPGFLDMLFRAAARHGLALDLHLDEHLAADRQLCGAVVERTLAYGLQGKVVVGHCSVLSAMPPGEAERIVTAFAEAGIGVVTLPAANLFLQGRDADRLPPRGLTRVRELLAAGVPVAAASDNLEDPFIPVGSGDLLEIARWTLLAAGLGSNQLADAFEMVTMAPARLMGLGDDYGVKVGARADLLVTEAEDQEDLVAHGSALRTVLVAGRAVAGRLETA